MEIAKKITFENNVLLVLDENGKEALVVPRRMISRICLDEDDEIPAMLVEVNAGRLFKHWFDLDPSILETTKKLLSDLAYINE